MNVLTVPGVANEPFKAALESTLSFNGYLAQSGTPKFYLDAEIQNLDQPLMGLDFDVVADVTYKVSGGAGRLRSIRSRPKAPRHSPTRRLAWIPFASQTNARCGRT